MRQTAGQLANKALSDTTKYDALEVGNAICEDIDKHISESIALHRDIFDEDEFCVVMVIASDPLIKNLMRRKFYCWPYLPKPRPNQTVFLYNKRLDKVTKRLWSLPCAEVMAELAGTNIIVNKRYQTMQAWSVAFFKGTFWDYIRHEHDITMLSEHEYFNAHKDELQRVAPLADPSIKEEFDFSKIVAGTHSDSIIDINKENDLQTLVI